MDNHISSFMKGFQGDSGNMFYVSSYFQGASGVNLGGGFIHISNFHPENWTRLLSWPICLSMG